MASSGPPPRRHVAVCAFPFGTHAAPLLLLVKRMAAVAPDVRFSFLNTENSNSVLFKAINVSNFPNIVPRGIMPNDHENIDGGHLNLKAIEVFIQASPDGIRRGLAEIEAEVGVAVSCLITDAFLWFGGEIAENNKISWVPLWTASSVSLSVHVHTDAIREKFKTIAHGSSPDEQELADCIPGLWNVHFGDLPFGVVTGNLDSTFSKMMHNMGLMLPKATAIVINSFEELLPTITEHLNSKMRLLNVGPFPLTSPPEVEPDQFGCLEWMDQQKPESVVYISFGTVATPPKEEVIALSEALEASGIPFIWSLKDHVKENLPVPFMDRVSEDKKFGLVVPWAPQMKLLAHPSMGVFVTHCGWNSIMESIVAGVPLICRPILGDQKLNQRLIECNLKFGVGIEGGAFTKDSTIKAFERILSTENGKEMRNSVKALKEQAEQAINPSSSSYKNFSELIQLVTGPMDN